MKTAPRTLLAAALLAALLPAAAPAARKAPPPTPDYNKAIDWVLLETNKTDAAGFDVFYVYPTLTNDPDQPLMDRTDPDVAEKTVGFVTAQTRALADVGGRIFAPYVRQAAYGPVISQILGKVPEGAPDPTETGVRDTLEAFRIFRERWNQGRPYVLFGHSQGAMDLFELLKRDASISVADGFVAAYLPGLPKITPEQFQAALGTRFSPAVEPHGSGVVAVWHTQAADCTENPLFTVPGGLCVNPLTWTTNTTPAPASLNRFAELYNGAQDSRIFVYGDGTNRCFYTGIDYDGIPRADYFPDLNVAQVGDSNTPITAMIRHYNRLLAFKLDSAWSISYSAITLADGSVTAGFYVTPVNRSIGNCAPGQAVLVENRPRTLDGRSVVEWKPTSSSGNINGDEEYYVIGSDGTALVHGIEPDAWYVYTNLKATCLINYKDELYYGTSTGELRHFSTEYFSDEGQAIDAYWESGSMAFDQDFKRKYSAMLWVGIKPEDNGYLAVTAETDRKSDFAEYSFTTGDAAGVPEMNRIKLKAKKFTYYKLKLSNNTADTTATVVSVDIRVRGTGYVR